MNFDDWTLRHEGLLKVILGAILVCWVAWVIDLGLSTDRKHTQQAAYREQSFRTSESDDFHAPLPGPFTYHGF